MDDYILERCEHEARSVEPVFPSIADALRLAADEIVRLRAAERLRVAGCAGKGA